ncbi:MAG: hypothetical protein V1927_00575 [Candidatus Omnitrophota bacterium]
MNRLFITILCFIFLAGCATSSGYYTDPNSKGYKEPHYEGSCLKCNRVFRFSRAVYDASSTRFGACPFCGMEQNLEMANQRYLYDQQNQSGSSDNILDMVNAFKGTSMLPYQVNSNIESNVTKSRQVTVFGPSRKNIYNRNGQQVGYIDGQ